MIFVPAVVFLSFPLLIRGNVHSGESIGLSDSLILTLYEEYRRALDDENDTPSRRILRNNKQYSIHVKKLKEVGGLKHHNLNVKETLRNGDELFYLINPIEAKVPKAYLALEEFKKLIEKDVLERKRLDPVTKPKKRAAKTARSIKRIYTTIKRSVSPKLIVPIARAKEKVSEIIKTVREKGEVIPKSVAIPKTTVEATTKEIITTTTELIPTTTELPITTDIEDTTVIPTTDSDIIIEEIITTTTELLPTTTELPTTTDIEDNTVIPTTDNYETTFSSIENIVDTTITDTEDTEDTTILPETTTIVDTPTTEPITTTTSEEELETTTEEELETTTDFNEEVTVFTDGPETENSTSDYEYYEITTEQTTTRKSTTTRATRGRPRVFMGSGFYK